MEQVIIKLIDKLPVSFIIIGCVLYSLKKICESDKGTFTKIVKYLDKKFKNSSEETKAHFQEIEKKIDRNTEEIKKIKKYDKEQDEFINMLLNESKKKND